MEAPSLLRCRFGGDAFNVLGSHIPSVTSAVQCTSPPQPEGVVAVEVSLNSLDYSGDSIVFRYDAALENVDPRSQAARCRSEWVNGDGVDSGSAWVL